MYSPAQTDTTRINLDDSPIPVFTRWLGSWRLSIHRRALSVPELAQSYDRVAASWDRTLDRFAYPDAYERLLRHVLAERLPACSGRPLRALDAGAGTGQLALALARASSTPVTIEAVDISEQMLQRADNRMSRAGLDFAVRQADARQLPYDDNTFDVAMTAHLLEHMPNPRLAIAEMVRVTRPGGLVVACLTRRSALGLYIHLKWRTHMVTPALAKSWFAEVGLRNPEYLSTQRKDFFRRMSIACAGTKSL